MNNQKLIIMETNNEITKVKKLSIKNIAKDNGFTLSISRHGCYTNYTLTKGDKIINVEAIKKKKRYLYTTLQ